MDEIKIRGGEVKMLEPQIIRKGPVKRGISWAWKILLFILVLAIMAGAVLFGPAVRNKYFEGETLTSGNNSAYSAIFLDNGQVYFGEISKKDNQEITLINVFYIQVAGNAEAAQAELNQAKFNLI